MFFAFCIHNAFAAQPFDVDGDGQEVLPEAIHALQVTSGLAEAAVLAGYDLAEYMWVDGGEYLMEFQVFSSIVRHGSVLNNISRTPQGGGVEQIVRSFQNGATKYYYSITPTQILFQGEDRYIDQYRENHYRYVPAAVQGLRNMEPGDVFNAIYLKEYSCTNPDSLTSPYDLEGLPYHIYVEYSFVGIESVTVPAGTFNDCIKIVRKIINTNSGSSVGVEIYYYAKNVGLVKWINPDVNSELSYAKVGSQTYPDSSSIVVGQGGWNDSVAGTSGQFYLSFNPGSSPVYTYLTLDGYLWNEDLQGYERMGFYLKSTNGVNFVPDPDFYDKYPPAPTLTFVVENNTITGTLDNATLSGTY